ncbi:sulfotransferase domain-containing protein [Pseudovibrio denitrificans]|uniref:sulfotransferase domain-containing protein n=1 Tax=Pseudovibrio denitrificans TaxID=258256 RepID=UPI0039BF0BFF
MAKANLKSIRPSKFDKDCVAIISLPKCGSTLLSYIGALVNTNGRIDSFRNDFDLVPMLSFPSKLIAQNFNARQDGRYQLYKANGRLIELSDPINTAEFSRVIWMCRDFEGYFRSWYSWSREFVPKQRWQRRYQQYLHWDVFKSRALETSARFHIEELLYAYRQSTSNKNSVLHLTYEDLVKHKDLTIQQIFNYLNIPTTDEEISQISAKTTKMAMAEGNRFDPLTFGDTEGVSKVNLSKHLNVLSDEDKRIYAKLFREKFEPYGIMSYDDLILHFRECRSHAHSINSFQQTVAGK